MKLTLKDIHSNPARMFYELRWGGVVCCPECGSVHIYNPSVGCLHICADCGFRFSDTSGTMFHSTKLSLEQWLIAIYLFLVSSRGLSSYSLSRYIGVTQKTSWLMLMKMRICLQRDIRFSCDDVIAVDELYLGANWKWKPSYVKYDRVGEPPAFYNLDEKDRKQWYKQKFIEVANADKMPVLGSVSLRSGKIRLDSLYHEGVKFSQNDVKEHLEQTIDITSDTVIVSDQSRLYAFLDKDKSCHHEICRHDINKYKSKNGFSSNRLEGAFSHVRRSWHGVYTHWSKKYNQLYLSEFSFRYNTPLTSVNDQGKKRQSKTVITDRFLEFFRYCDPRVCSFS